ncbi:hypothetical protein [Coprobacter fastidiosus]|uniref:hypothetical protein n=1 Tax=Coprobacter fastidiosus TaxID=1099853 RepID=UPI0026701259|nr:hypothetical protein [Coprobacter fastidiosus]
MKNFFTFYWDYSSCLPNVTVLKNTIWKKHIVIAIWTLSEPYYDIDIALFK